MEINLLSVREVSKILKVSIKTLHRWEKRGILISQRTEGRHRRYALEQINQFKKEKGTKTITATSNIAPRVTYFSKFLTENKPLSRQLKDMNRSIARLTISRSGDKKGFFPGLSEIIPKAFEIIDPKGRKYLLFFFSLLVIVPFVAIFSNHLRTGYMRSNIKTGQPLVLGDQKKLSLGSGTITSGNLEVYINLPALTDKSKIFITPTTLTGRQMLIAQKLSEKGFIVRIEKAYSRDINFNWWIVDEE